jgi:predicted secreted Zn-dependent protease
VLNEDSNGQRNWKISTRCGNGACVEVAIDGDLVHMRNSTDPAGPALALPHAEWRGFLKGIKGGRF